MAWAWALKLHHEAHRPPHPTVHDSDDTPAYSSKVLMDDCVLVEPDLGFRPHVSEAVYLDGLQCRLGPKSLNLKKDKSEGQFATRCVAWGLEYDTLQLSISMPEPKRLKLAWLVQQNCFDWGYENCPLVEVQRLHGMLQYYVVVQPVLRAELGSVSQMLHEDPENARLAHPAKDEEDPEAAWEEFWQTVEYLRVLTGKPERWETSFVNGLLMTLQPSDLMQLDRRQVIWLGGDATLQVGAVIDWTCKAYAKHNVQQCVHQLIEAAGGNESDLIIALTELHVVVVFCCLPAHTAKWRDKLVVNVTDNSVVMRWIRHRCSRNRLARHLLRLLSHSELRGGFRLTSTYIRTYHNVTADDLTRVADNSVDLRLQEAGFTSRHVEKEWQAYLSRSLHMQMSVKE
eukprot:6483214-Amphidinium_carterae.1